MVSHVALQRFAPSSISRCPWPRSSTALALRLGLAKPIVHMLHGNTLSSPRCAASLSTEGQNQFSGLGSETKAFAQQSGKRETRLVHISDTHNLHHQLSVDDLPDGDVLVHTGDAVDYGLPEEFASFNSWLEDAKRVKGYRAAFFVAGNHEWCGRAHYGKDGIFPEDEFLFDGKDAAGELFNKKLVGHYINQPDKHAEWSHRVREAIVTNRTTNLLQELLPAAKVLDSDVGVVEFEGLRFFGVGFSPFAASGNPDQLSQWGNSEGLLQQAKEQQGLPDASTLKPERAFDDITKYTIDVLLTHASAHGVETESVDPDSTIVIDPVDQATGIRGSSIALKRAIEQRKPRAILWGHSHSGGPSWDAEHHVFTKSNLNNVRSPVTRNLLLNGVDVIMNNSMKNDPVDASVVNDLVGVPRVVIATPTDDDEWRFSLPTDIGASLL